MATLVIKKELCKQFRRKGRWALAIFIIILAVCAFKVTKKFQNLRKDLKKDFMRDFATVDDLVDLRDSNYRQFSLLETRISGLRQSRENSQSLDNILEIIRTQRQEINDLKIQMRTIQQSQAASQVNHQNTRTTETQMKTLSNSLDQMKRENELLKRQQLEMTQKYEKAILMMGDDYMDQDYKQAIHKKLSELVNANYGHEQTFKDVKRSVDNCAKQASLIALEAYIDDKLSTSTPSSQSHHQASPSEAMLPVLREMKQMKRDLVQLNSQNEDTKVLLTKIELDQKLNNQRVTALETQQQEDEKLKASFNEASNFIEKTLKDSEIFKNPQNFEKTLEAYMKSMENLYPELQEQIEKTLGQNMNLGQGHFGRRPHPHPHHHHHHHHRQNRRYENVEPSRTHERVFGGQKQESVNSMTLNDLAKKTPEELMQLMDQLLA